FRIPENSPIYKLAADAGSEIGLDMVSDISGGGSDANLFNEKGIESVILGTGMQAVHTVKEYIRFDDLVNCAKHITNIISLHR
ncbi:MAG: M20/M25/M40 family metallo-hydrolase, partial [bacterium]